MPALPSSDPLTTERLRSTYLQLPLTLSVNLLNYMVCGFVLMATEEPARIVPWCVTAAVLTLIRFWAWRRYRQDSRVLSEATWTRLAVGGAALSGSLWGGIAYSLFPSAIQYQLFLSVVIAGMCAGAATVHAAHVPTAMAFVLPAVLPLALRFLETGQELQVITGLMALFFAGSLFMITRRFSRWFSASVQAQHELALRSIELHETNARLRAEIDRHRTTGAMLRESHKMEAVGLLTAGVAHDFNNLLTTIGGSAGIVLRRLPSDSPLSPPLEAIAEAVRRGAVLTRQLLAFGRKQTLTPQVVNINEMLEDMRRLLASTVAGQVRLTFDLSPNIPPAVIDAQQLENAILNVMINARDATPTGGRISIRTYTTSIGAEREGEVPAGDYLVIEVSDTGTGMTEAVRQRAFDPFFTTKQVGQGSGLGLSQVYGLLRQSGGGLELDSAPGRGTIVRLYVPPGQLGG
jgi:signal transduction histidine kinase